jgi:hypothetical protein
MIVRRAGTLAKQKRLRIAVTGLCVSPKYQRIIQARESRLRIRFEDVGYN